MKELTVSPINTEALPEVIAFVEEELQKTGCPLKALHQVVIAVEEIFVNIARYAYHPEVGDATIRCTVDKEPLRITIQFLDRGKPYNPLERTPPDTALPPEERDIGGLGILLVRRTMSHIDYAYKDGLNILTLRKDL